MLFLHGHAELLLKKRNFAGAGRKHAVHQMMQPFLMMMHA